MLLNNKKILMPIIIFVFLMTVLITGAYDILSYTVRNITVQSINEICDHDQKSIREYVSEQWNAMNAICAELQIENASDIESLQRKLSTKVDAGRFEHIYMMDAEGNLYADGGTEYSSAENSFLPYFEKGGDKFVYRYEDDGSHKEMDREYLMYGLSFGDDGMQIGSAKFVGMAAVSDIAAIQNKLRITSFDGKGQSNIINRDGFYIINPMSIIETEEQTNFFDLVNEGEVKGITKEEVKESINNKSDIEFTYISAAGVQKYVSVKQIEDSNWMFVNSVETSVFAAQTRRFIIIMMGVIVSLLVSLSIVAFVYIIALRRLKKFYSGIVDGMFNRQYYEDKLSKDKVKALAVIDLDHLKTINDNYGHVAGDLAIEAMAKVLIENAGSLGDVVRYGGDEFVVGFKSFIAREHFESILNNIRSSVEKTVIDGFPEVKLTASIGGLYREGVVENLFKEADTLMYKAKKSRNSVATGC